VSPPLHLHGNAPSRSVTPNHNTPRQELQIATPSRWAQNLGQLDIKPIERLALLGATRAPIALLFGLGASFAARMADIHGILSSLGFPTVPILQTVAASMGAAIIAAWISWLTRPLVLRRILRRFARHSIYQGQAPHLILYVNERVKRLALEAVEEFKKTNQPPCEMVVSGNLRKMKGRARELVFNRKEKRSLIALYNNLLQINPSPRILVFVSACCTGQTLRRIEALLKKRAPDFRVVAVEKWTQSTFIPDFYIWEVKSGQVVPHRHTPLVIV